MAGFTPIQTPDRLINQIQRNLQGAINPLAQNPINNGNLITGISLVAGVNTIPHKLGRLQQGWNLADITGAANVYRTAPFNTSTLVLTSSAAVTISLYCF